MEVNKKTEPPKTERISRAVRRISEGDGGGRVKQNYDEIITEKRDEGGEVVVEKQKEKGFNIQRAWCCLMSRRTS